jgi:hypothetical protein
MNKYFNFEVYTIDPITKTTGWDILMVSVKAENIQEARENLRFFPNFDCRILYNFQHDENETADFLVCKNYPIFKIKDRISRIPLEYHRKPTAGEIRFGEGATHYLDFDAIEYLKKDGTIKKRIKCKITGLIYTR